MTYKNLEEECERIFKEKVLPFLKDNINRDSKSEPVYYLLENLKVNRFRSGLPLIIGKEYGLKEDILIPLAAIFESTFTTAMAQDDFYDGDESRENIEATHKKFGIKETLLSCDYFNHKLISALIKNLKGKLPSNKINELLYIINYEMAKAYSSVLIELESRENIFSITHANLKELYLSKTAHGRMLLECVFLLADNKSLINAIKLYSNHLAIAGQLKNDLYDFTKHNRYRGFSDLRQGYITWPLFLVINSFNENEKNYFIKNLNEKNYSALLEILRLKNMVEKTLDLINYHVEKAKSLVDNNFPKNIKDLLNLWAEGNRTFSVAPKL
jgi:geranylgeranyl pyrophosphate synthase